MAAITTIDMASRDYKLCETIAITNQTAASTTVSKAIAIPRWARRATFVIGSLTMAGTNPRFDFVVKGYDVAANGGAAPDDGYLYMLGGWDGITQKTAASDTDTVVDIGPEVDVDDTGSATASDRYGVQAALPRWLVYQYTTVDNADDADYAATISLYLMP